MDWILGSGLRFGRLVVALAIGLTAIGIAQLHSAWPATSTAPASGI